MIDPGTFYRPEDHPDERETRGMWRAIATDLRFGPRHSFIVDRRSFVYGIAAAILLTFASVGIYTTLRNAVQEAQPDAVQVDRAYEVAIGAFERVAFQQTRPDTASNGRLDLSRARAQQMQDLDTAIRVLRQEAGPGDVSPMIRSALRDLYAKKLSLLQTMIEQGDIEL